MELTPKTTGSYRTVCLYCRQTVSAPSYSCECMGEEWIRLYRSQDIVIDSDDIYDQVQKSFEAYSFGDDAGMLQYRGLPFRANNRRSIPRTGVTPLYGLSRLSNRYGCRIFLKDEGKNPSGCFKDRETVMCFLNSNRRGLNKAVIYSSGNAAASAAIYVKYSGHHLVTFVAGDTYTEKIGFIRSYGSDVIVIGDRRTSFEDGYRLFSQLNDAGIFTDKGFDNWSVRNPFRVQGDKTIAVEIARQLFSYGREPLSADFVVVPTANGSCLAGIWKGFKELRKAKVIDRLPRMVSVGIKHANPVQKAVRKGETSRPVRCNLSEVDPEDAEVGSIILAEEGYDSIQAAKAVMESNGMALGLHADELCNAFVDLLSMESHLVTKNNILPEPAALTSLAAVKKMKEKISLSSSDVIVPILTGHGLKAREKLESLLSDRPDLQVRVQKIMSDSKEEMPGGSPTKGRAVRVQATLGAVARTFHQLQKSRPS